MSITIAAIADSAPAGGAETVQVIAVTAAMSLLIAGLLGLGFLHRATRGGPLRPLARFAEQVSGLPAWAAIPAFMVACSLVPALLGLVWDEALHIDDGRDAGPLANPSHFVLLYGIFGTFAAGWMALILPEPGERPGRAAVRITRTWHVPVGGLLLLGGASLTLVGFPLDDVSHRLFGQDVTLWGTTHLQMLGGAVLAVLATCVLMAEGAAARGLRDPLAARGARSAPWWARVFSPRVRLAMMTGGILAGLSIFQGEFDYGVPQFRLLFHPLLIAAGAAFALVLARQIGGRGAAFGAVAFYLTLRAGFTLLVGPVLGESVASFPLYLAEALLVEGVAIAISPRARPLRFALVAATLIGTVGVLAEYGWSHVWMAVPWPEHLLVSAIAVALPAALAMSLVATFTAGGLTLRADRVGRQAAALAATGLVTIAGLFAWLAQTSAPTARAQVTLAVVPGSENPREAVATVRITPANAAKDPDWLTTIAWQGSERVRIAALHRIAEGVYRSEPLPISGTWKTAIRLHRGARMGGVPVYMPADTAIPAAEIPARAQFTRPFREDRLILQRERRDDVAGWIVTLFSGLVLLLVGGFTALTGAALVRVARAGVTEAEAHKQAPPPRPAGPPAIRERVPAVHA